MNRSTLYSDEPFLSQNMADEIDFIDSTLVQFIKNENDISLFLMLDDFYMITQINIWASSSRDTVLKDLCEHFVYRKPYLMIGESNESEAVSNDTYAEIKSQLGEFFPYYYLQDNYIDNPYKDTYLLGKSTAEESEKIWVYDKDGNIQEFSEHSKIIKSLKNNLNKKSRAYLHRDWVHVLEPGGRNGN